MTPSRCSVGSDRIGQDVAPEDVALRQALGAAGRHVVGLHLLEQRGAQVAHQERHQPDGRAQRRQEQVVQMLGKAVAVAAHRKPAELHAEEAATA